jgi:hypothetical protein
VFEYMRVHGLLIDESKGREVLESVTALRSHSH